MVQSPPNPPEPNPSEPQTAPDPTGPPGPTGPTGPTTTESLRALVGNVLGFVKNVGTQVNRLAEDLAADVGAVSRDAEAFGRAAMDGWLALKGGARATPRLTRLLGSGTRILALWRLLRLRALARGEPADGNPAIHRALAIATREAAVELRGAILKAGQVASCRPDLFPAPWIEELALLQDRVPALPSEVIFAAIDAQLGSREAHFAALEAEALAAASLAQVHAARLHDGREVVVKVLVPGARETVEADIGALRVLAKMAPDIVPGVELAPIVAELARALTAELDYRTEAQNLEAFRAATLAAGDGVLVPTLVPELVTGEVMVMERIVGTRLGDALAALVAAGDLATRDAILVTIVRSVACQVFVHGVVHADPHPGNYLVTPDHQVAVLDFGSVLHIPPAERAAYARLFVSLLAGQTERAAVELANLGFEASSEGDLLAMALQIVDAVRPGRAIADIDMNAELARFVAKLQAAAQNGTAVRVPPSFVLLGRVLGTLAGLLLEHKPKLEPFAILAPYLARAVASAASAPSAPSAPFDHPGDMAHSAP